MLDFCLETLGAFLSPGTSAAVGATKVTQAVYKSSEKRLVAQHRAEKTASRKREEELKRELKDSQADLRDAIEFIRNS